MSNIQRRSVVERLRGRVRTFVRECMAATAIEYALVASGIAIAVATVILDLGNPVTPRYETVYNALTNGGGGGEGGE